MTLIFFLCPVNRWQGHSCGFSKAKKYFMYLTRVFHCIGMPYMVGTEDTATEDTARNSAKWSMKYRYTKTSAAGQLLVFVITGTDRHQDHAA
jgi:hypothetical protein